MSHISKFKILIVILVVIHLCCVKYLKSQNRIENEFKYWLYKERLKYFVTGGTGIAAGEALIMSERNSRNFYGENNDFNFSQGPTKLAYYLGVLSTEYYLLLKRNELEDANKAILEIDRVLNTIERLDLIAEQMPPWNTNEVWNGFMIRKDIPFDAWNNPENEFNKELNELLGIGGNVPESTASEKYYKGHPGYAYYQETPDKVNAYNNGSYYLHDQVLMSKDEITGLMIGLRFIYIYVPVYRQRISIMTNRLITYVANIDKQNGEKQWMIYRPDGEPVGNATESINFREKIGSHANAIEYASPFLMFLLLTNNTRTYSNLKSKDNSYQPEKIWSTITTTPCMPASNTTMLLAAGIASATMSTNQIALQSLFYPTDKCFNKGGGWSHFYFALDYLFNSSSVKETIDSKPIIEDDLNNAPCGGPYNFGSHDFAKNGWASHFKYDKGYNVQYGASPPETGVYPGTDYMLMYNMWRIIFEDQNIPYKNHIDLDISEENISKAHKAVNTITSSENIKNGGNVTYTASKSITLKPGFKVEKGATFKASLTPCFCEKDGSTILTDAKNSKGNMEYVPLSQFAKDSINNKIIKEIDTTSSLQADSYSIDQSNKQYTLTTSYSQDLIIKPNPFDSKIEIVSDYNLADMMFVKVYDVYGNILANESIPYSRNIVFNFEENGIINSGMYLLEIIVNNQVQKIPVVKIK